VSNSRILAAAAIAAAALPLFGSTYVVPADRVLVDQSHAIVIATVIGSHVRSTEQSGIETVTSVRVEETIKGASIDDVIDIVEPGGKYGDTLKVIGGVPTFEPGERLLLMLMTRPDGEPAVLDLALGKFAFDHDVYGQSVLVRDEGEIVGWDPQFRPYVEKRRAADAFVAFVRQQVSGAAPSADYYIPAFPLEPRQHRAGVASHVPSTEIAPFTAASYTLGPPGARWPGFASNVFYGRGLATEPGASGNGDGAINAAMNAWDGVSGAIIKIQYNNQSRSDTGINNQNHGDGQNSVQFERNLSNVAPAFSCSSGGLLGIGGFFGAGTHSGPNNETFSTITEADVEMNQGIANCAALFNSGDFDSAVAHEVGHSIGWRHANLAPDNSACVSASMECATSAIMTSVVTNNIHATPQTWDQHAAQAVYPGAVVCTNPAISVQPAGSTITQGNSANLSVSATGTTPTYQWYIGNPGTTNNPVANGATAQISVSPASTTTYFVRVSGCSTFVDSNAVTITVNPVVCTNPSINSQPSSPTIALGNSTTLTVGAAGTALTYQWFNGSPPSAASPINGATSSSVLVNPATTSTYWVRVTGQCGSPVNSIAATVTVVCTPAQITQQPLGASIIAGSSAQLSVAASGSSLNYQWYQGNAPSTATPVPNGAGISIFVSPTTTTNYWVRVTAPCGSPADSNTVTVTVGVCTSPVISGASALPSQIAIGGSASLSASVSGSVGTIQWYRGTPPDKSNPVSPTGVTVTVSPTTTTTYWLQANSGCGAAATNSSAVTVIVGNACIVPVLIQPANQTVLAGATTTLAISATGTAPLHYQWFKGTKGTRTSPVGTDSAFLTTEAVNTTLQYWVEVTNSCSGTSPPQSNTITLTPYISRHRSTRH
jgi:hypothetical protein